MNILLMGYSARWFAQLALASAYKASLRVADAFCDYDYDRMRIPCEPFVPGSLPGGLAGCQGAICLGGAEHDAALVARVGERAQVFGAAPATLVALQDQPALFRGLVRQGFRAPATLFEGAAPDGNWLHKPLQGGGGTGIARAAPGQPLPKDCLLQEELPGQSASLSFLANGTHILPLGFTRQLIGDAAFHAPPFHYAGNIVAAMGEPAHTQALDLAQYLTRAYRLQGLNCLDFLLLPDKNACFLELNPRPGAGAELFAAQDPFLLHMAACQGSLLSPGPAPASVRGKAILYALQDTPMPGSTPRWYGAGVRDVPRPHTVIQGGTPLCTLLAQGETAAACHGALAAAARRVENWIREEPA